MCTYITRSKKEGGKDQKRWDDDTPLVRSVRRYDLDELDKKTKKLRTKRKGKAGYHGVHGVLFFFFFLYFLFLYFLISLFLFLILISRGGSVFLSFFAHVLMHRERSIC